MIACYKIVIVFLLGCKWRHQNDSPRLYLWIFIRKNIHKYGTTAHLMYIACVRDEYFCHFSSLDISIILLVPVMNICHYSSPNVSMMLQVPVKNIRHYTLSNVSMMLQVPVRNVCHYRLPNVSMILLVSVMNIYHTISF